MAWSGGIFLTTNTNNQATKKWGASTSRATSETRNRPPPQTPSNPTIVIHHPTRKLSTARWKAVQVEKPIPNMLTKHMQTTRRYCSTLFPFNMHRNDCFRNFISISSAADSDFRPPAAVLPVRVQFATARRENQIRNGFISVHEHEAASFGRSIRCGGCAGLTWATSGQKSIKIFTILCFRIVNNFFLIKPLTKKSNSKARPNQSSSFFNSWCNWMLATTCRAGFWKKWILYEEF